MSSSLSSVPVERRRQAAAVAGLLATLFAAMGVVPWTGEAPPALRVFSVVALVAAVLLGLVAWGLLASAGADRAEARLDAAIASTVAAADPAQASFDCGHDHDPDEMHVRHGETCPSGQTCRHDCATCVLSAQRR